MRSRVRGLAGVRRAATISLCLGLALGLFGGAATTASAQTPTTNAQSGLGSLTDLISRLTGSNRGRSGSDQARQRASEQSHAARSKQFKDPRTRFVVAIENPVKFQVFALTNPNRVILDMPAVRMWLPQQTRRPVGVITKFRGGKAGSNRSRVVIDVSEPVVVDQATIVRNAKTGQDEIIVDILPVRAKQARDLKRVQLQSAAMGLGGLGLGRIGRSTKSAVQPPLPQAARPPRELKEERFRPLIVIDPGHGGKDSGAKKWGTVEKDVVLKFSHVLRKKLLATGRYRVKMTRYDDRFIPLLARRQFAERHKAALFIAVHADYAGSGARGATIYSLRDRVASRLRKSAKRSVTDTVLSKQEAARIRKARGDVSAVRGILADLAARDVDATHRKTDIFTKSVIRKMSASTNMRRRPDQQAAFKVLRTAKVPSVLIELAYVSNKRDAALLRSEKWRQRVSGSIVNAVDNYFSHSITRLPL